MVLPSAWLTLVALVLEERQVVVPAWEETEAEQLVAAVQAVKVGHPPANL